MEFKGLKSQYLFIFAGGLLAVFVVFIVLFMAGVNQWLCIGFIVSASLLLVWQTFRLNAKYGTHGLMKDIPLEKVHEFQSSFLDRMHASHEADVLKPLASGQIDRNIELIIEKEAAATVMQFRRK